MTAPLRGATDIFGLGSDWESQGAAKNETSQRATWTKANGDIGGDDTFGEDEKVTCSYIYIGSATNFGAAFDSAGCNVGEKPGSYLITKISIDYKPCSEGKRPVVTFEGVSGYSGDSNIYKPSLTLPTTPGEVPDLVTNSDSSSEVTEADYSITVNYGDDEAANGDIIRGGTYGAEEAVNLKYYGIPTLATTGWSVTSSSQDDSPKDYSTSSYALVRGVARVTT